MKWLLPKNQNKLNNKKFNNNYKNCYSLQIKIN